MADDWDERFGWAWDLISEDPTRRDAAHLRLDGLRVTRAAAGTRQEHEEASRRLLPDGLWIGSGPGLARLPRAVRYRLLYLDWEVRFPHEWAWHAKSWPTKKSLLRTFHQRVDELPDWIRTVLADLVLLVAARPHRLGDERYARLARVLADDRLRDGLRELGEHADEGVRLRAGYLTWVVGKRILPEPKPCQWRDYLQELGLVEEPAERSPAILPLVREGRVPTLVRCPRCAGPAEAGCPTPDDNRQVWRVTCVHCPYTAARRPEFLHGNRRDGSEVHDPVFRLPLWLQQPCASGRLWAYGPGHLDAIEQHLRARVRLADGGAYLPTYQVDLPDWMMPLDRRDELLAGIAALRATVPIATAAR
ncbi:hypothetical protein [Catellatospora citrea]|uniref:Uncharacterized protein n=1 Tax=Catellatospora citrea TaxID=53366 RepID=A0A8J3KR47_9ACTN|nr:hypothetical protein [Catellatospora citrea]RKE12027.1 hypothetical protein C8E86_6961 [Catellatospora citrea]GIG00460.1 hypothetical protein Cci01nite_55530 [Catellatospora citrea]